MENTDRHLNKISINELSDLIQVGVTTLKAGRLFFGVEVERNEKMPEDTQKTT